MENSGYKARRINPGARHRARKKALQLLYAWQISPEMDINHLKKEFISSQPMQKVDMEYFDALALGVCQYITEIDHQLSYALQEMRLDEVNFVERVILRIAAYELCIARQLPKAIVLNEAIVLAKTFGSAEGHRLINGILDFLDACPRASTSI